MPSKACINYKIIRNYFQNMKTKEYQYYQLLSESLCFYIVMRLFKMVTYFECAYKMPGHVPIRK